MGLVEPKLFNLGTSPDRIIPLLLIVGALISALILYVPAFVEMYLGLGTLLNRTAMGNPNNPGEGTLLARLGMLVDAIGSPKNPESKTLLGQISKVAEAIGSSNNPETETLLARLASVEKSVAAIEKSVAAIGSPVSPEPSVAAIGSSGSPDPGTLLARIGKLETFVAAISNPNNPRSGTI
jgi:hypothetical protein